MPRTAPTDPVAQDLAVAREDLANVHYTIGDLRRQYKGVDPDSTDFAALHDWMLTRLEELESALGVMIADPPTARMAASMFAESGHIYGTPDAGQWVWSGSRWLPVRAGCGALSAMTDTAVIFDGLQWSGMARPLESRSL
jgi:hypothetical protein